MRGDRFGTRVRQSSIQMHLRMPQADADLLRQLAEERDQSLSAVVRFLLRRHHVERRKHGIVTSLGNERQRSDGSG